MCLTFQVVENHCGWTEKQNQDTLADLKQVIKDKDEIIEVICVKHIFLGHLSLKLKWAFLIIPCLLSLCLSIYIQTNFNQKFAHASLV